MKQEYSFIRYLAAKTSVDDRALNRHVWDTLLEVSPRTTEATPLRVLEIGAGIGTMVERLWQWGLLTHADYTAIDAEPTNIQVAENRLRHLRQHITLRLEAVDLFDFIDRERGGQTWDLLIAHAFLDLMDVPAMLPLLFTLLPPGGLFYFTANFDGATILQPAIDPAFDALVERLYHQTMDERVTAGRSSGDSRCGRHLFGHLCQVGAQILAAGSSDWVVFAGQGGYPADEAYFLHFIVHTIHQALHGHPDLEAGRFEAWIARRHAQIERGELVYMAHQVDFLGRATARSGGDNR
ncbi:MAG TPA: class I SAM-dependent methyltransferase [Anaerolineae bacterium]